jgi:hypothetical protein
MYACTTKLNKKENYSTWQPAMNTIAHLNPYRSLIGSEVSILSSIYPIRKENIPQFFQMNSWTTSNQKIKGVVA